MRTDALSKDDYLVGGLALLLVIDLFFLPWFSVSVGPYSATTTATGSFDGWLAILAVLAAALVLADLLVERLSPQTTVPNFGGSRVTTRFYLSAIAAGFLVLKILFHPHFGWAGFGFWAGIVLAAGLVFVTFRDNQGRPLLGGATGTGTSV
jgi:hypothetical protein